MQGVKSLFFKLPQLSKCMFKIYRPKGQSMAKTAEFYVYSMIKNLTN
jgi:hypothetical protein